MILVKWLNDPYHNLILDSPKIIISFKYKKKKVGKKYRKTSDLIGKNKLKNDLYV